MGAALVSIKEGFNKENNLKPKMTTALRLVFSAQVFGARLASILDVLYAFHGQGQRVNYTYQPQRRMKLRIWNPPPKK